MDINFELYKIFYHTAAAGSFSGAAEKLYISQSAVSQAVKNLEEKMSVRLFSRRTRSIKLTSEGELLFKHVQQAYNFIKTAENKVQEMQKLDSGEIRIGIGDTICKYYLIPYLERFNRLYPGIKIQVINRTSSQILDILKMGRMDFGVVTLPVADKSVSTEEFITVEDIFVASRRFSALQGKKTALQELTQYPLLMLPRSSATRQNIDGFLTQKGITVVPEIELESMDLLVEFARIGLGIAHVLRESAAAAVEKGELFEVETLETLPSRRLGLATMQDVPLSRASGEFIGFLKDTPAY